jgi:hypothetical protein
MQYADTGVVDNGERLYTPGLMPIACEEKTMETYKKHNEIMLNPIIFFIAAPSFEIVYVERGNFTQLF